VTWGLPVEPKQKKKSRILEKVVITADYSAFSVYVILMI
jgi:hypothetical protein